MKNLDSVLNSRDITLPTKICIVKSCSQHSRWGPKVVDAQFGTKKLETELKF